MMRAMNEFGPAGNYGVLTNRTHRPIRPLNPANRGFNIFSRRKNGNRVKESSRCLNGNIDCKRTFFYCTALKCEKNLTFIF
jgi:hypothetical protein